MAKDPAILLYTADLLVGMMTLNWEERGKYITLLASMHQQGRMKEETIRFLVGSISENLASKFKIDGNGYWYNSRLEEEAEKRANFTKSRRDNGKKGGRPKKITSKKPKGKPTHNHIEDVDINENEILEKIEILQGGLGGGKELLVKDIAEYFSINQNSMAYLNLLTFIENKEYGLVYDQFQGYKKYKKISGEKKVHSFNNWLGSENLAWADGAWCSCDWKTRVENYRRSEYLID